MPATLVASLPIGQPPLSTQTTPQSQKRKFNVAYVIILVLAVLLTGSVVALFYEKGKREANANVAGETESPSNPFRTEQNTNSSTNSSAPNASQTPTVTADKNQSRFHLNPCGSIRDSQTSLEWYVGPDRNMTWYEAQQWTAGLNQCSGGWRMPSIEEVRTLYNPSSSAGTGFYLNGRYYPAHIDPVFNGIGGGSWVWSDEKVGADAARSFNLNQGKAVVYSAMNTYYSTRAFAVRKAKV
ncbi:MAG TPA: DUF1566 domain-containing protein [Pyrinomonadaceae bacterium]